MFKSFKSEVAMHIQTFISDTGKMSLSQLDAVRIGCTSYQAAIIERPQNSVSGFRGTGLFPLSLPNLTKRWELYQRGGVKGNLGKVSWLTTRQVIRSEVLTLPPKVTPTIKRKRKTIDVGGRLVTREFLQSTVV